jgi:Flp pilus assembly pilin Flp
MAGDGPRHRRCRNEVGSAATEYALLITLIVITLIGAISLLGDATSGLFGPICNPPSPFSC